MATSCLSKCLKGKGIADQVTKFGQNWSKSYQTLTFEGNSCITCWKSDFINMNISGFTTAFLVTMATAWWMVTDACMCMPEHPQQKYCKANFGEFWLKLSMSAWFAYVQYMVCFEMVF